MTAILQNAIPGQTGVNAYTAEWFTLSGVSQGAAATMTEGYPGTYTASPPSDMADSTLPYILVIKKGSVEEGRTNYFWNGTREIDVSFLRDRLAAIVGEAWSNATAPVRSLTAAVTTDAASRTASQATGFATPANVTAVITAGDARWLTGNTIAPNNALLTQLNTDFLGLLVPGDKTRLTSVALSNAPGGGSSPTDIASAVRGELEPLLFDPITDLVNIGKVAGVTVTGTADFKANITGLATATNVSNSQTTITNAIALIPTNPLLDISYVAPNNALLTQLNTDFLGLLSGDKTRLTTTALSNAPGGGSGGSTAGDIATAVRGELEPLLFDPITDLVNIGKVAGVTVTGTADFKTNITGLATTANLTPLTDAIAAIPTNPLLASNYTPPDNTGITTLTGLVSAGKFTANALSLAPLGGGSTASEIAAALTVEIGPLLFDPASDSVNIGNLSDIVTALRDELDADLSTLKMQGDVSTIPMLGNVTVDRETAIATYTSPNGTIIRKQLNNPQGAASVTEVFQSIALV